MPNLAETKARISGPIPGLPVLFNPDDTINHAGMRDHVQFLIDSGIKAVLISIGISEYYVLTEAEVRAIFTNVAKAAEDRLLVIGSTGPWPTRQAREFAYFADGSGVGALLIKAPETESLAYNPAVHDNALFEHFEAVASATQLGVLFHERIIYARGVHRPWSLDLIKRMTQIENVIGLKEESWDFLYSIEILKAVGNRLAMIDDASKWSFIFTYPQGAPAYVSGIAQFAPSISLRFWEALKQNDLVEARRIITDIEIPITQLMLKVGWVGFIKTAMELCGLPASALRKPGVSLTSDQVKQVRELFTQLGIIS